MDLSDLYLSVFSGFPDVLTVEELSEALGVCTKTAYRLIKENKIKYIKIRRTFRIPQAHLFAFLDLE